MFGCLRKALTTVVLLGLGAAAGYWGPQLWHRYRADAVPIEVGGRSPSPELANETLDRLEALRTREGGDELRLGDSEINSVVRYALPGVLPPGVEDTTIRVREGHVEVAARVALAAFPDLPSLSDVAEILPDTVPVEMEGILTPLAASYLALHVSRMEAAHIPLPSRMIPEILRGLGRRSVENLPPDAVAIPLPDGLSTVYVLGDSLVLVAGAAGH